MATGESNRTCWKKIGTFGDRSCPKLAVLAHCRNCTAYSAAGRSLLDREMPEGYLQEWTDLLASLKEEGKIETISTILFRLQGELLALKTVFFQEAAEATVPHSIPLRTGEVFKGIVNVNGELILCVDLAALLGIPREEGGGTADHKVYPRLIVVNRDGQRFAFPVDEVFGVHRFPLTVIQALPATVSRSIRALTAGVLPWKRKTAGLLDEEKLFSALSRSISP